MLVARVIARLEPGGAPAPGRCASFKPCANAESGASCSPAKPPCTGCVCFARLESRSTSGRGAGLQYECSQGFTTWLRPRLAGAHLVHAHMFGGWWAASEAVAGDVPLVASEHNEICWPGPPRDREMCQALRRVDAFFGHGPATPADALRLGLPGARLYEGRSAIEPAIAVPGLELPRPRLVFAGRLHPEKGRRPAD